MRQLKNPAIGVPDEFRYTHKETSFTNKHIQYWGLLDDVATHRRGNSLPPVTEAEVQDQICAGIPPEWCEYEKGDAPSVNTRLSLNDVVDFTKVLIAHAQNREFVSQEEADRRARICASCFYNVIVSGCGTCAKIASLISTDKTTKHDNQLQNCAVCRCYNKAQVHFPLAVLESSDTDEKQQLYPVDFCWKNKLSPNYLAP